MEFSAYLWDRELVLFTEPKNGLCKLVNTQRAKFILEDRDTKPSALTLRTPKGGNDSSFYVFIRIDLFVFGWLRAGYT